MNKLSNISKNMKFFNNLLKILVFFVFFSYLSNCSSNTDPVTGEKVIINPNPKEKAREYADKGGGIFGDINKKSSVNT